jgi:hypothetical protein
MLDPKKNAAKKTKLARSREQLASIRDQEQRFRDLERQGKEIAATKIGRIVIEHLENGKPFDDEFKERVSSIIAL